ncbi:MAG: enoyl-CoA hydratase/isomerase family protein [Deltaproteobacteria bacterium]|jgi:methylglutaconyl-CoA hydratase|nr:enoyl-CoA hydratase/isomerase family protein [Deltaproteobacteria bacterium]
MGKDEASEYEIRDRAAWIRLACPENRNALSTKLLGELSQHLQTAMDDPGVRVIVLTGSDGIFCAGADLKSRGSGVADGAGDNAFVGILKRMREGPKPVICAVNGHAFGGGIGLIAAADIAIAVYGANFAFSEVRLGVIPAIISVVVLPKLGEHQAMRLFLTGERFSATDALGYGLLHRVVEEHDLESAVQAEIDAIAKGAPSAVAAAKRLVREIPQLAPDDAYASAAEKIAELFASPEAAEGMAAFAQKRPPSWVETSDDET